MNKNSITKEQVEKLVLPKFINRKANRRFLETVPNRNFLDLSIIYYIPLDNYSKVFVINEELIQQLEITEKELYRWANKNQKNDSAVFSLMNFLSGKEENLISEQNLNEPMYLLTNKNLLFGASMVLNKKMMEEISLKMNDDVLMIPSSVHEWILLPFHGFDTEEIDETINFVNQTTVGEEEILSNHKYVYWRDLKKMKIA